MLPMYSLSASRKTYTEPQRKRCRKSKELDHVFTDTTTTTESGERRLIGKKILLCPRLRRRSPIFKWCHESGAWGVKRPSTSVKLDDITGKVLLLQRDDGRYDVVRTFSSSGRSDVSGYVPQFVSQSLPAPHVQLHEALTLNNLDEDAHPPEFLVRIARGGSRRMASKNFGDTPRNPDEVLRGRVLIKIIHGKYLVKLDVRSRRGLTHETQHIPTHVAPPA